MPKTKSKLTYQACIISDRACNMLDGQPIISNAAYETLETQINILERQSKMMKTQSKASKAQSKMANQRLEIGKLSFML